jgi:hypothetical protein
MSANRETFVDDEVINRLNSVIKNTQQLRSTIKKKKSAMKGGSLNSEISSASTISFSSNHSKSNKKRKSKPHKKTDIPTTSTISFSSSSARSSSGTQKTSSSSSKNIPQSISESDDEMSLFTPSSLYNSRQVTGKKKNKSTSTTLADISSDSSSSPSFGQEGGNLDSRETKLLNELSDIIKK